MFTEREIFLIKSDVERSLKDFKFLQKSYPWQTTSDLIKEYEILLEKLSNKEEDDA